MSISVDLRNYIKELKPVCEICKKASTQEIHHKDQNHHNNTVSNLIAVCKKCHRKRGMHRNPFNTPVNKIRLIARKYLTGARRLKETHSYGLFIRDIFRVLRKRCPFSCLCIKKQQED